MPKKSLFRKIFVLIILMSFIVGVTISVVTARERTQLVKEALIQKSTLLAEVSSQITESGYLAGRFPFQAIKLIADSENILFLWIVKPDGEVYFADKPEMYAQKVNTPFLGTEEVVVTDIIYPQPGEKIKLIVHPLKMKLGEKPWSLYLGVSLASVAAAKWKVVFTTLIFFLGMIIVMAFISLYLVKRMTSSLRQLYEGIKIIGKGNLNYKANIQTGDEIEELANAFNRMVEDLKESRSIIEESKQVLEVRVKARTKALEELTQRLEEKVKERTKELQERVEELERFHRLTVGRELKMIELKKEIRGLREKLNTVKDGGG